MLESLKAGIIKSHDKEIQEENKMSKEDQSVAGDDEYYEEEEVEEEEDEEVEEEEEESQSESRLDRVKGIVSDRASNIKANVQGRIQEVQSIRAAEKAAYNERRAQLQAETYIEKETAAVQRGRQKAEQKYKGKTPTIMTQRVRQVANNVGNRFEEETGATKEQTAFNEFNSNKGPNQGFLDEIRSSGPKTISNKNNKIPNKANAFDTEINTMSKRTISRTPTKGTRNNKKENRGKGSVNKQKPDLVKRYFGDDVYNKRPLNPHALNAEFDVKSGGIFDEFNGKQRGEDPFTSKQRGGNRDVFGEEGKARQNKKLPPEFI